MCQRLICRVLNLMTLTCFRGDSYCGIDDYTDREREREKKDPPPPPPPDTHIHSMHAHTTLMHTQTPHTLGMTKATIPWENSRLTVTVCFISILISKHVCVLPFIFVLLCCYWKNLFVITVVSVCILLQEFDIDPEADGDQVDELLSMCVRQAVQS